VKPNRVEIDKIFERYLRFLEHYGVPQTASWSGQTGLASSCCSAPLSTYSGEVKCSRCRKKCGERELREAPRTSRNNDWKKMYVNETRSSSKDVEQQRRVGQAQLSLAYEELFEVVPIDMSHFLWRFGLIAWACALRPGVRSSSWSATCEVVAGLGRKYRRGEGLWSTEEVKMAISEPRHRTSQRFAASSLLQKSLGSRVADGSRSGFDVASWVDKMPKASDSGESKRYPD
jgi:uncharacterized Zn finger protein (UPF0148 family)